MGPSRQSPGCLDICQGSSEWTLRLHEAPLDDVVAGDAFRLLRFAKFVEETLSGRHQRAIDIDWLSQDEKAAIRRLACPPRACPTGTVLDRFTYAVANHPSKMAVVDPAECMTFAELDDIADRIAAYLQGEGFADGMNIGVSLGRNVRHVAAALGVLKAGCAYVPLDSAYPAARLATMARIAELATVICDGDFPEVSRRLIFSDCIKDASRPIPRRNYSSASPAYLIFTSGSAGEPKGVVIEHGSLVHLLSGLEERVYADDQARELIVGVNGSFSFDTSIKQLFQIAQGRTIAILPTEARLDTVILKELLAILHIGCVDCTPSQLRLWLDDGVFADDRTYPCKVLVGGETIDGELWDRLCSIPRIQFYNLYGPTECTVDSTSALISPGTPSLGLPLPGVEIQVRRSNLQQCGFREEGEFWISGDGVARGYACNDEATADSFVLVDQKRCYRSGDRGWLNPDGTLIFSGRTDQQIKIRGHRVEVGEVEYAVRSIFGVADVKAVADTNGQLVAFVKMRSDEQPQTEFLHAEATKLLPSFMQPSRYLIVHEFPLTPNGKTDSARLAELATDKTKERCGAVGEDGSKLEARSGLERLLSEIWSDVLKRQDFGVTDGFFELGGDSIKCIQVVSRARKRGLSLRVAQLFSHQTIESLAASLEPQETEPALAKTLDVPFTSDEIPLTPIQQRFFDRKLQRYGHWNQKRLVRLAALSGQQLREALAFVASAHDVFRIRFTKRQGGWKQYYKPINSGDLFSYSEVDLSSVDLAEQRRAVFDHIQMHEREMELEGSPLFALHYFNTGPGKAVACMCAHHLVVDSVSWQTLAEDLETYLLRTRDVAPLAAVPRHKYRQWSEALRQLAQLGTFSSEVGFWQAQIGSPDSRLRPDYPEIANYLSDGIQRTLQVELPQRSPSFGELVERCGVSTENLLLSAISLASRDVFGLGAITIELEGHGRQQEVVEQMAGTELDISSAMGWFTSIHPATFALPPGRSPTQIVADIVGQRRRIPNGGLGYGILRYLDGNDILSGSEPASILFNYFGASAAASVEHNTILSHCNWPLPSDRTTDGEQPYELEVDCVTTPRTAEFAMTFHKARVNPERWDLFASRVEYWIVSLPELLISEVVDGSAAQKRGAHRTSDEPYDGHGVLPATPIQATMLERQLTNPFPGQYLFTVSFPIAGRLELDMFRERLAQVTRRADALREVYRRSETGQWWRVMLQHADASVEEIKLDGPGGSATTLSDICRREKRRAIEVSSGPPIRWVLVQKTDQLTELVVTWSTVALDLTSLLMLVAAIMKPELSGDHDNDVAFQSASPYHLEMSQKRWADSEPAWLDMLKGFEFRPLLAPGYKPPILPAEERYTELYCIIDSAVAEKLRRLGRQAVVTLNTVTQVAWARTLMKATGQSNICLGVTVIGRSPDNSRMLGRFLNTLPLRIDLCDGNLFESLRRAQEFQATILDHEWSPIDFIKRAIWGLPEERFYESVYVFENTSITADQWKDHNLAGIPIFIGPPEAPLKLEVAPDIDGRFQVMLGFLRNCVSRRKATALLSSFADELEALCVQTSGEQSNVK